MAVLDTSLFMRATEGLYVEGRHVPSNSVSLQPCKPTVSAGLGTAGYSTEDFFVKSSIGNMLLSYKGLLEEDIFCCSNHIAFLYEAPLSRQGHSSSLHQVIAKKKKRKVIVISSMKLHQKGEGVTNPKITLECLSIDGSAKGIFENVHLVS